MPVNDLQVNNNPNIILVLVAILFAVFTAGYILNNYSKRSIYAVKHKGVGKYLNCEFLKCKIDRIVYDKNKGYLLKCSDGEIQLEFQLNKLTLKKLKGNNMYINLAKVRNEDTCIYEYLYFPDSENGVEFEVSFDRDDIISYSEMLEINEKSNKYTNIGFMLLFLGVISVYENPLLSIIANGITVYINSENNPMKSWTKSPQTCIIKLKEEKLEPSIPVENNSNKQTIPPEIMEQSAEDSVSLERLEALVDNMDFSNTEHPSDMIKVSIETEPLLEIDVPVVENKVCSLCGGVMPADAIYCSYCASKLDSSESNVQETEKVVPPVAADIDFQEDVFDIEILESTAEDSELIQQERPTIAKPEEIKEDTVSATKKPHNKKRRPKNKKKKTSEFSDLMDKVSNDENQ